MANSNQLDLEEAILDSELRYINFFNGRLLTGGDLSAEQAANRACSRHLGQAVGAGVAQGLEVSISQGSLPTNPRVNVAAGLALNRAGQTLRLESMQTVVLVRPSDQMSVAGCVFADCSLLPSSNLSGAGCYLLTIAPASARDGLAPVNGLGSAVADCNSRYFVDGVQFRMIQLDVPGDAFDPAKLSLLRNRIAYGCFGADDTSGFTADPFGTKFGNYGLVDKLRPNRLTDSEVPLAVLFWTADKGLNFVDQWSVRRRVTHPSPDTAWPLVVSDRRASEGEAMFLQFQNQIAELQMSQTGLDHLTAAQWFEHLPPVGLLSIAPVGTTPGFSYQKFFEQQAYHPPALIESALLQPLVYTALAYRPVSLVRKDPIRLYQVVVGTNVQPYVVFTTALVPFDGAARFDIARWDLANFA